MKAVSFAALALVVMQLLPLARTNPPEEQPLVIQDSRVADIVERACADCHTHSTEWPWYSRVAPVSWWLVHHVEEGREHLNLSTWGTVAPDRQDHLLEELEEYVEEREMPLRSYMLGHPEARITDEERQVVIDWARRTREGIGHGSASGEAVDETEH
ncbi:MAG: heme-binding domain-containing protein [Gemmatimonadales bacterium]|jgi:hypothetical protein|nr:MAG: heme-binding domain-containing protein [Gemmatimonadales bacterium]